MVARWNKELIGAEILHLHASGEDLSYGEMQRNNLALLRAAGRYFGSWKNAIEYAGLDYDEIRRYRTWTNDRIIEAIRKYAALGADLSWRHVCLELDPPLAAAAIRANRFGSWQCALEAAGLDYEEIRRHRDWNADAVLDELRRRQAVGESLRVTDATEQCPALVAAARRHFDGWYEAILAAGLDEWEARIGLSDEYDEDSARGETSWADARAAS